MGQYVGVLENSSKMLGICWRMLENVGNMFDVGAREKYLLEG